MDIKKTIGVALIALGVVGLITGILGIFEGRNLFNLNPWGPAILGLIFFFAGVAILQSLGRGKHKTVIEEK